MIKVLKQKILWQSWGFVRTVGREDQRKGPVRTFYTKKIILGMGDYDANASFLSNKYFLKTL